MANNKELICTEEYQTLYERCHKNPSHYNPVWLHMEYIHKSNLYNEVVLCLKDILNFVIYVFKQN